MMCALDLFLAYGQYLQEGYRLLRGFIGSQRVLLRRSG
ncbi:hypothetical protein BN2476_1530018 [Paraburkholderia piptadeniae]|uniref:Uncharacterized protein n=1 Tax=Paraburkholderia piptadeniae TaxID=1701573 RepID=A0A1N7SX52_9BURK|nr:hypothetical protein BN2476_1530018 [Paraburkholderia piptadeniae]